MKNFIEEVTWRGMLHDVMPGTEELFEKEQVSGYIGFDPTSDSLHIGSLVPILLLVHLQRAGHKPVALVGGATGMVGDPSGKSEERNLLSEETLQFNLAGVKKQLAHFLNFDPSMPNAAEMVNNYDWFKDFNFLKAIDKSLLKQWLKMASIPAVLFLFTFLFQPQIILEGSSRVAQFNRDFYPPNPYNFKIINSDFTIFKNESSVLQVEFLGNKIPENLYLLLQNQSFRFTKKGTVFEIQVPPITSSSDFVLKMGEFYSDSYNFNLVQKPSIQNFKIKKILWKIAIINVSILIYRLITLLPYSPSSLCIFFKNARK